MRSSATCFILVKIFLDTVYFKTSVAYSAANTSRSKARRDKASTACAISLALVGPREDLSKARGIAMLHRIIALRFQ